MARVLPRSLAIIRHLLLVVLAIGIVQRMGSGCEAMAATPTTAATHQAHCAGMPAKPDKPIKSDAATCTLCIALPDATVDKVGAAPFLTIEPVAGLTYRLAGLVRGPAPPPPKIA